MEIKAIARYIKMGPRKIRLVADVIRGLEAVKALDQLAFINKKASTPVIKLIKSAMANGEHNYELDKNNLYIKEIKVDEAGKLKRWQPKAHGRATPIRKRMSHISLILAEVKDSGVVKSKKQTLEAPVNLEEMVSKAKKSEKEAKNEKPEGDKKNSKKDETKKPEEIIGAKKIISKPEKADKKGFVDRMFRRKGG